MARRVPYQEPLARRRRSVPPGFADTNVHHVIRTTLAVIKLANINQRFTIADSSDNENVGARRRMAMT